ncbi:hypothetical protein NQ318_012523 [Aromia moschata]|uniref:Transposase n=1 Tax=Aromia moschata TaxID=1265417 RepID=A0AAV8Y1A8_9CUCU|nr:hypothetical protein NQ318_012523 [Aromia moschata]
METGMDATDPGGGPSQRAISEHDRLRRQNTNAGRSCSPIQEKYPELPLISQAQGTVSKIDKQFRERGHVRQHKKNPFNKLSDDQKLDVMLMLEENPHTSSRQTASALNISHSSILRVLTENQMHPYKLVPTNELAEDNFDRRILLCEQMTQLIDNKNVLFSDESTFTLHGHVNRQNYRYWSREYPHWMRELHTQNPEKVNVCAGIIGENIIGPFFIDGNLN